MSALAAAPERTFITDAANGLHRAVVQAKEDLQRGAFTLGGALARMQDERAYTALGCATFEDYLAGPEVAIHRGTAYRFIRVFRAYQHVALGLRGSYDIQKLDILSKIIDADTDPATIAALVEEARPIPREELRAKVNAVRAARKTPRAVPTPPPAQVGTPLVAQERATADGFAAIAQSLAADPRYVGLALCRTFLGLEHALLRAHDRDIRELVASTTPEEMARVLLDPAAAGGVRFGSGARRYARDLQPIIAWYARVGELLNDPPSTIQRVK